MINYLSSGIAYFISQISEATSVIWRNINLSEFSVFQVTLDILLVAALFYWIIMLIRQTRATNITLGVIILMFVFAMSRLFNLFALGWLLDRLLTVILVAIPIIFQQELRRGLEKLGRTKFFLAREAKEIDFIRSQIIEACFEMAKKKIGGIIVFRGEVGLKEYVDTGVQLSARISAELIFSIFSHESPLHDGACIVDQNRLLAAGCILPQSFKEYGHKFGTRHKSALSLSEVTDAKIFVVSEERGKVSFVSEGDIEEDISPARAEVLITHILSPKGFKKK